MAGSAILNTVYNHYLTTYSVKGSSPFDSHKKSELREVCNTITKLNKEAPLFLPASLSTATYAVQLKESARSLRNTIASISSLGEGQLLSKKAAFSSNEDSVSATFIGSAEDASTSPSFDIQVNSLATTQMNLGYFLPKEKVSIKPDTYAFDININDLNYEFQYSINENETNQEVQSRLVRLINNANIGITADIVTNDEDATSLRLTSVATGSPEHGEMIFQINDQNTSKASGSVDYLGIDFTARTPANASFLLNGEARETRNNSFEVGKLFNIELLGPSPEEEPVHVGLKTDTESLTDNISSLIDGYNSFLKLADTSNPAVKGNHRLIREMKSISNYYRGNLELTGLHTAEDGTISINKEELSQAVNDTEAATLFSGIEAFTQSLIRKTGQISINPMQYTDRTVVAYKNPGRSFPNPYVNSPYTGMLFNSYC